MEPLSNLETVHFTKSTKIQNNEYKLIHIFLQFVSASFLDEYKIFQNEKR